MALFRVLPLPTKWPNIPAHDVVSSVDYFLTISPLIMAEDPKNVLKATSLCREEDRENLNIHKHGSEHTNHM